MIISVDLNKYVSGGAWLLKLFSFILASAVVILSPWCFSSWEMWTFWPMAALLFASAASGGLGAVLGSAFTGMTRNTKDPGGFSCEKTVWILFGSMAPFLVYALWRYSADLTPVNMVEMESERSILLIFTPVILMLTLFLTASPARLKTLLALFLVNSVILAVYAAVNLFVTENIKVLWSTPPFHYGNRATGPFFCPNDFAAYMNLALCFAIAVVLTPGVRPGMRIISGLAAIPLFAGQFLTLSRGGAISFVLMTPMLLIAGLRGWPWKRRLILTLASVCAVVIAVAVVLNVPNPLLERINSHTLINKIRTAGENGWEPVKDAFNYGFDRGVYINAALRAWKSAPVCGIGPGQHAIRWYEFAATQDGDRATGKWPRQTNHDFTLYEVHSDWTQLLEEYGALGLSFFLIPFFTAAVLLFISQTRVLHSHGKSKSAFERAAPLAAILAFAVFTIHSLGDFSLQIPAVNWAVAAVIACGMLSSLPSSSGDSKHHSHSHYHSHRHHHSHHQPEDTTETENGASA